MIKLFPTGPEAAATNETDRLDVEAEVANEPRTPPTDRPWLYTNMVASADGGTAVDGRSGQLGGPADKAMFAALRAVADVIIVGASTVREERYRPPNQNERIVADRLARGQSAHPRLAVISGSLSLDLDLPLFDDPENRPYIITTESAPDPERTRLGGDADILTAGTEGVDLVEALRELHRAGARTVLSEGGPSINGQLIADDLVDEWNLSLSPRLLGADSKRAAVGPLPAGPPRAMVLRRVWTEDDLLFCRWTRATTDV